MTEVKVISKNWVKFYINEIKKVLKEKSGLTDNQIAIKLSTKKVLITLETLNDLLKDNFYSTMQLTGRKLNCLKFTPSGLKKGKTDEIIITWSIK